jgi:hypothetical protein
MTDLVSTLADQIMALINAKPRSPTKAEIEETVRACMDTHPGTITLTFGDRTTLRTVAIHGQCGPSERVELGDFVTINSDGTITKWKRPSDWDNTSNKVICVEGKGGTGGATDPAACGGGGGKAWSSAFVTDHLNYGSLAQPKTDEAVLKTLATKSPAAALSLETLQAAAAKLLANAEDETHADRAAWDAQAEKYRRLAEGS